MPGAHKIGAAISGARIAGRNFIPKGPKIKKKKKQTKQDRPPGLKLSSETENFKRAAHQTPIVGGKLLRSRLTISSEIEFFKREIEKFKRDWIFSIPVSPYPLNLGGDMLPPKLRGRRVRHPLFYSVFEVRPLNLGGENVTPKFRGFGLTGSFFWKN